MTTLGEYLSKLRDQKGWTMRELSRRSGVSLGAIQKIENGSTQGPGIDAIVELSKALGVHPMKFLIAYQGQNPDTENWENYLSDEQLAAVTKIFPDDVVARFVMKSFKGLTAG